MAQKIRSIELDNGTVVTFLPDGLIDLDGKVSIHTTDLESIRDTTKSNAKIEAASNGTIQPNKEAMKS